MKAVIFDRDGVIIDSVAINISSAVKAFKELGIEIKEEEKEWRLRCPINTFGDKLLDENIITKITFENMEKEIAQEIDLAVKFADESPFPVAEDLESDIYAPDNL